MNAGFILAIGMILIAGLAIVVVVARRAGTDDPGSRYGRELEPDAARGGGGAIGRLSGGSARWLR